MIMVILGVLSWPGIARLVRAQMLSAREQEFVTAAKALGIKEGKIIFRHILPNVITKCFGKPDSELCYKHAHRVLIELP